MQIYGQEIAGNTRQNNKRKVGLDFPGTSGMSWRPTLPSILLTVTLEWALLVCPLACCYSKLESLLEMQNTRPHPGILSQKLHFSNIPRKLIYTLKIEEHWCRLLQWPLQDLPVLGLILTYQVREQSSWNVHLAQSFSIFKNHKTSLAYSGKSKLHDMVCAALVITLPF